jgi:hypothetical protein
VVWQRGNQKVIPGQAADRSGNHCRALAREAIVKLVHIGNEPETGRKAALQHSHTIAASEYVDKELLVASIDAGCSVINPEKRVCYVGISGDEQVALAGDADTSQAAAAAKSDLDSFFIGYFS